MSMNAQSINQLVGSGTIAFNDLQKITNGKYNMGEVQAVIGQDKIEFARVNNHIHRTGSNNVVSTPEQNLKTNAAIFKAIATEFGDGGNVDALFARDLSTIKFAEEPVSNASSSVDESGEQSSEQSVGEQFEDLFDGFSNPYVKEAFKFLLTGGNQYRSVSRDEIHMLLQNLRSYANSGPGDVQRGEDEVKESMQKLNALREFKETGSWKDKTVEDEHRQGEYLFGWNHAIGVKATRLAKVSDNQKQSVYLKRFQDWQSKALENARNEGQVKRYREILDGHPELCIDMVKEFDQIKDQYDEFGLENENKRQNAAKELGRSFAERLKKLGDHGENLDDLRNTFATIASIGARELLGEGIEMQSDTVNYSDWIAKGLKEVN